MRAARKPSTSRQLRSISINNKTRTSICELLTDDGEHQTRARPKAKQKSARPRAQRKRHLFARSPHAKLAALDGLEVSEVARTYTLAHRPDRLITVIISACARATADQLLIRTLSRSSARSSARPPVRPLARRLLITMRDDEPTINWHLSHGLAQEQGGHLSFVVRFVSFLSKPALDALRRRPEQLHRSPFPHLDSSRARARKALGPGQ